MKDDFARGKCPICGCETMFRMNKNRILYTFCRNGHHAKLGREDSIVATAKIAGNQNWNNGIVYLYPLEKGKENEKTGNTGTNTGTGTINPTGTTNSARTEFKQSRNDISGTVAGTSGGIFGKRRNYTDTDTAEQPDDWGGWL